MTDTAQAQHYQPSAQVVSALQLAACAVENAAEVGALIEPKWADLTHPGDHNSNAAIYLWRAAKEAADLASERAAEAAATEATAQELSKAAAHHRRNWESADPSVRIFAERVEPQVSDAAAAHYAEARRLADQVTELYDKEVMIPLTSARHFIAIWDSGRAYPASLERVEFRYGQQSDDDTRQIYAALYKYGVTLYITEPIPTFPYYEIGIEIGKDTKPLAQIDCELKAIIAQNRKPTP